MQLHPHSLHPEAQREAAEALEWYMERDPVVATRFLDALDDAIESIRAHPEAWSPFLGSTRRRVLEGFPFSVIYRLRDGHIQIVAIPHHRRRPGYWTGRLRR